MRNPDARLATLFTSAIITALLPSIALCQVASYTFSHYNGNYGEVTIFDPGLGDTSTDEQRFVDPTAPLGGSATTGPGFNMGFDFVYNGYVYDRIAINANGWISLGHNSLSPAVDITSTGGTAPNQRGFLSATNAVAQPGHRSRIGGFAADLIATPTATLIQHNIGTTPNQVKVIQWKNYAIAGITGSVVNFQIRLQETTNRVEVAYGTMTPAAIAVLAGVGLGGYSTSDFNNRETTTSWMATTAGTSTLASCTFSNTVTTPNFGRTFRWQPSNCTPPGAQAFELENCSNGTFSIQVDITAIGSGPTVSIVPSAGSPITGIASPGTHILGPYALGTQVSVNVQNGQEPACSVNAGTVSDCCGSHCSTAMAAIVGSNYTPPMNCGFGASDPSASKGPGTHARWFSWTAPQNGLFSVSSCGPVNTGNADTRLSVWSGACGTLTLVGHNDDACAWANGGTDYASALTNMPAAAGTTYYIEWDDHWNPNGFGWNLAFSAGSQCTGTPNAGVATIITAPPYCDNGTVTMNSNAVNSATGINYQWFTGPELDEPVIGGTGSNTLTYTTGDLPAGEHRFVLRAVCSATFQAAFSNEVIVVVSGYPNLNLAAEPLACSEQWFEMCVESPTADFFHWIGPDGWEGELFCTGRAAIPSAEGAYTVHGSNGPGTCSTSLNFWVSIQQTPEAANSILNNTQCIGTSAASEVIQAEGVGTAHWYATENSNTLLSTGDVLDPLSTGLVNVNSAGTYTFWIAYNDGGCFSPRTPVNYHVGDENLSITFDTQSIPFALYYSIIDAATDEVVLMRQGFNLPAGQGIQVSHCVPGNRNYRLRIHDTGNATLGYVLRQGSTNKRIIDNQSNFIGPTSQITGNAYSFSLPMGTNGVLSTSCDKTWWRSGEFIVAREDTDVSDLWIYGAANNAQNPQTGYEFWFYNPNGGYSFRKFRPHTQSDGFGNVGPVRACHLQINNWAATQHIPEHQLMNVRVRARVNGVNKAWGPACRFVRNEALALCPPTKLMDLPGNQFLSCGQTRQFVSGQRVHARPVSGANRYQWRFRIPAEGVEIVRTSTTYFLNFPWAASVAAPLVNGKTYEVDVRASKDNGLTWCGLNGYPWGDVCLLTIGSSSSQSALVNPSVAEEDEASSNALVADERETRVSIFPNPNGGQQLFLHLTNLTAGAQMASVEIYDSLGKRVHSSMVAAQDGYMNSVLDVSGLTHGMYLVSITAGNSTFNERLVIQR